MRTAEHSARELGSRTARQRLPIQSRPYFTHIQGGLSLGYRRGKRGGTWIARVYELERGYRFESLGKSNDFIETVGMSFQQAQDAAREWLKRKSEEDAGHAPSNLYTVANVVDDYLLDRERIRRKRLGHTRSVIETHILPNLGSTELVKLTHAKVKGWRDTIAEQAPKVRNKPGVTGSTRQIDVDNPDALRKRQATANRILTVLKAALNHGYREGKVSSRAAWERVTAFTQVDVPKVRYLSIAESTALIAACGEGFRQLVRAALYTGCRYGEITALTVDAFNMKARTLHIRQSKSGKDRYIPLTDEGVAFFDSIAAGRSKRVMFLHEDGRPWEPSQQTYWMAQACKVSRLNEAISFHILRHTYASQLAMGGAPMPVIAALLGHADTRMTEKHYGHLAPSYIADTLRATLPSFGFEGD